MPEKGEKTKRLSDEDKARIDALEVGGGLQFPDLESAKCAITRLSLQKKGSTRRQNEDGTVNVWRAR